MKSLFVLHRRWMRRSQVPAEQRRFSLPDERQEGGRVRVQILQTVPPIHPIAAQVDSTPHKVSTKMKK
jgi:hypothetical protein